MALVQQNLVPATGDHLITLDTESNLEWLSLDATANLSYLELSLIHISEPTRPY